MKTIYLIQDKAGQNLVEGDVVVKDTRKANGAANGHEYRVVSFKKKKNDWVIHHHST